MKINRENSIYPTPLLVASCQLKKKHEMKYDSNTNKKYEKKNGFCNISVLYIDSGTTQKISSLNLLYKKESAFCIFVYYIKFHISNFILFVSDYAKFCYNSYLQKHQNEHF